MPKRTFESIRKSRERGIAAYLTAIFMLVMIPIVGLAIDGGFAFVIRTRLSAAADASALAAGRGINLASTVAAAQAQATSQATAFFNANFPSGYMNTSTLAVPALLHPPSR
jgi:Flp pilus assembly protein TadG